MSDGEDGALSCSDDEDEDFPLSVGVGEDFSFAVEEDSGFSLTREDDGDDFLSDVEGFSFSGGDEDVALSLSCDVDVVLLFSEDELFVLSDESPG